MLDDTNLEMTDSTIDGVLRTLGPSMRDHFRRDNRSKGGCKLSPPSSVTIASKPLLGMLATTPQ